MSKTQWLDRRIGRQGPFLTLCLSEREFRKAIKRLKPPSIPRWVNLGADAMMHTFEHSKNGTVCLVCLVCLAGTKGRSPVEIAGLLVHEAVHVWQQWCDDVGEHSSGSEQEAYAIQAISQELMAEYARRIA